MSNTTINPQPAASKVLAAVLGVSLVAGAAILAPAAILWLSGCDNSGGTTSVSAATGYDKAAARRGKELFGTKCIACHEPTGAGKPNLGKDLIHSEFVAGKTDDELLAFIKTGRPVTDPLNTTKIEMPPKGGNPDMTDAQLKDIIQFLRKIQVDAKAAK